MIEPGVMKKHPRMPRFLRRLSFISDAMLEVVVVLAWSALVGLLTGYGTGVPRLGVSVSVGVLAGLLGIVVLRHGPRWWGHLGDLIFSEEAGKRFPENLDQEEGDDYVFYV